VSGLHTVHVRVNDAATGQPTPCRVRFSDPDGRYYAPFGRAATLVALEKNALEYEGSVLLSADSRPAAYIDGGCEIRLPPGPIHVEITRGFEYRPIQTVVDQPAGKMAMRFTLERWADARAECWYSGDIRCHDLTPHAALLEGAAEDLAVVNLLSWRGRHLVAFSGQRPALEAPGTQVVVNTFNTHRVLGQLALLNCHRIVFPLTFGVPDGPDAWTLGDWCNQCHRKQGLVVWTGPGYRGLIPYGEPFANLVLGQVDVLEVPLLSEGLLRDWYTMLDANLRVPLASGSGKAGPIDALGMPRTYARLAAGEPFAYQPWIEAVRAGRTFVSAGPLLEFSVNGQEAGARVDLPAPGRVAVSARARSILPFDRLEIVINGVAVAGVEAVGKMPYEAQVEGNLDIAASGWIGARCWGRSVWKAGGKAAACLAHTSPVYLQVAGAPHRADPIKLAHLTDQLNQMLNWAEHGAQYENAAQRDALTGTFRSALAELVRRAGLDG